MISTTDILLLSFGIAGYACALTMSLVPLIKFKEIMRNKSTNDISGNSFVLNLFECLLVAWYGVPFVSKNNFLVTLLNGFSAILQLIYLFIIIIYSPMKKKFKIIGLITFVAVVFSALAYISLFAFHGKGRQEFVGQLSSVFAILMLNGPILALAAQN